MASAESRSVAEMLRASSPFAGEFDVAAMRAAIEGFMGGAKPPPDVRYEPAITGGVRAEWAVAENASAERAVLYLHGGGYVIGSPATHRGLVGDLSRASGARMLSLDYGLAPEAPFPAAIHDAVSGYRHLLGLGLDPSRIAIAGDSAGGGLTVATLLALRDAGDPLPAAGVCLSPWLDLTLSGESMTSRADEDPLVTREGLEKMAALYLDGADPHTGLASPLFADLAGLPPLLVQVGTAETLLDDSVRFAARARAAGVDVELEPWEDMIHVWHSFATMVPEGRQAIERIGEYLRVRLA
jgi:acetyl esterase/lipase